MACFTCQTVLGLTMSILTKIGGGVTRTASSSWMSALRKALVMSTLDHVVSGAVSKLSINRKSGASRLVVVECSPRALVDFCACSLGLHHLQSVGSELAVV